MPAKKIDLYFLLFVGLALIGCKRSVDLSIPGGGAGFLFRVTNPSEASLKAMVEAVHARLDLMGLERAKVSMYEDQLILVRISGISRKEAGRVQDTLLQPTRLAFSSVESDREFFNSLKSQLPKDGSIRLGLDGDQPALEDQRIEYAYLMASRREKLEAFLNIVRPPEGRKFWIMPAEQGAAAYLLKHPPELQNFTVTEASVKTEEDTGRTMVFINLEEKHRQAFAKLTQEQLHRRLAVLVDGEIRSLPVVETVIRKAQLQISPSPVTSDEVAKREARALAAGIKAWGRAGGLSLVKQSVTPLS